MKTCMSIFAPLASITLALLAFSGCGGGGSSNQPTSPDLHNQWTWVGGSNIANQPGTYGTEGTAAAANIPGGRQGPVNWTDASGAFWLFGGIAAPSQSSDNYFNDLWKYSAGEWTWVGGADTYNQSGIYGIQGSAAPDNIPGARCFSVSWKDGSGNFWLFGGLGLDSLGRSELLNDLWEYTGGEWIWVGGSDVATGQPGTYGTLGMPAPGNLPGGRAYAANWTDASGNFWLFGGSGYDSTGANDYLNDLWKYSGGEWTWVGGWNVVDQPGVYGTQGVAAPGNTPGARIEAGNWIDSSGNLWLFGGSPGPDGQFNIFNDLWKYSGGQWTWVSGSDSENQIGNYGTKGTAAATNVPGARVAPITWTDASGTLWMFGGDGYDSAGGVGVLSDLWKFSGGQWTWVDGPDVATQQGIYGTLGTASSTNIPGARVQSASWMDASGNFWLFGGLGMDSTGTLGYLNDLWKFEP